MGDKDVLNIPNLFLCCNAISESQFRTLSGVWVELWGTQGHFEYSNNDRKDHDILHFASRVNV